MRNYNLSFISNDDLFNHIKETVNKYRFKIDFKKLNKNLLDPIKLTFDAAIYQGGFSNIHLERILESEVIRQIDKSNTNHIGYFHQNIFKYIGQAEGWTVPLKGFDIENHELNIFVEMKNKHNTMNSSSSAKTYMRMQNQVLKNPKSVCMLVEIIAKNSQNIAWKCSVDNQTMEFENIRRVSIDKFYEIVTGKTTAFLDLCEVLPLVIQDVIKEQNFQVIENTVISDLQEKGVENILEKLYLIAFKKYQGFENFRLEI